MSEIASRVKAIIADKLNVDENEVTENAEFTKASLFPMTRLKASLQLRMLSTTSKLQRTNFLHSDFLIN